MGALRKAGVWLGLVEEDDDRGYDDGGYREHGDAATASPRLPVEPVRRRVRRRGRRRGRGRRRRRGRGRRARPARPSAPRAGAPSGRPGRRRSAPERGRAGQRPLDHPAGAGEPRRADATRPGTTSRWRRRSQLRERAVVAEEEQRYQITTLHPTTYHEARTIGEHFRDGVPVIMNLTEMDEADAKPSGRLRRRAGVRAARYDRARDQPGVPALTGQRPGHRGGQGQDRRGRVLQPELDADRGTSPAVLSIVFQVALPAALRLLADAAWPDSSWAPCSQYGRRWQPGRGAAAATGSRCGASLIRPSRR